MNRKPKDITGERFGMLIAIKPTGELKNHTFIWECLCDCGKTVYVRGTDLRGGGTKSCGCYRKIASQIYHLHHRKLDPDIAGLNMLYGAYKSDAKRRKHIFSLSKDEFKSIIEQNCHYCDAEPKQIMTTRKYKYKIVYNGIDRKDSSLGYTLNNCVPCCKYCNRAKNDLSYDEFLNKIEAIYNNRIRKEKL